MKRILMFPMIAILAMATSALAQIPMATTPTANLASFSGTYTFEMAQLKGYSPMYSMNGQQVGFCNNGMMPIGYNCYDSYTFDLLAGTLVSDGAGHITSGSYSQTRDPNSYKCGPKNSPTTPCPVVVPSGNAYSSTTTYNPGATVDYTVNGTKRTFQAVRKNVGKAPNWVTSTTQANICNNNPNNLSTCFWTQVSNSLTAADSDSSGTLVGTYTMQANGSGVLTLTPSNCNGCGSAQFGIVLSPVSQVGQTVGLVGMSQLGNSNRDVGTAIRIK